VSVENGVVSLMGFVRRYSQKLQAKMDAKRVSGVMAVANDLEVRLCLRRFETGSRTSRVIWPRSNHIKLAPRGKPTEIKGKIVDALKRIAQIDANRITVGGSSGEVVLEGSVRPRAERDEAERAAWMALGVIR
jgi:osmotically-inducible protein OsmY